MAEGNYIRFYENYDGKLDKDTFTTIRPDDPIRFQAGKVYDIYLGEEKVCKALMIKLNVITDLKKLPLNVIKLDTGLDTSEEFIALLEKFYGDVSKMNWVILTLKKL